VKKIIISIPRFVCQMHSHYRMYRSVIKNFNPTATVNDGSCTYRSAKVRVKYSIQLPATLHETSGLVLDNLFWTTNDDTDTTIYGVDTTGVIQKSSP
jgi:hypothetical protein